MAISRRILELSLELRATLISSLNDIFDSRAVVVAQWLGAGLVIWRLWVQILPGAGLFVSLLFLYLYFSVKFPSTCPKKGTIQLIGSES